MHLVDIRPDPARKLFDINHCYVYSEKPLMMDRGTVRNMYSFDVLLTVHLSIFISVFNQLDAQNLFHL